MVKHQRRSHQHGIHSSELDDGDTSDSDSGESPTTPEHYSQIQWLQNGQPTTAHSIIQHSSGHTIHRTHSFNDFGHQYGIAQPYEQKHNTTGGVPGYNSLSGVQDPIHSHMVVPRAPINQHPYYIPEQGNPGVATMNTNSNVSIRQYQVGPHQQLKRSNSYPPQTVPSVQNSPGTFSSASSRSPAPQDGYYTHHPVQTPTSYNASPIDQQPIIQFQQQTPAMSQAQQQPLVSPAPLIAHVQAQYQHIPQEQHWYSNLPYQEPVQVSPVHCGDTLYNPWVEKIDYNGDIQHALPSARIETL